MNKNLKKQADFKSIAKSQLASLIGSTGLKGEKALMVPSLPYIPKERSLTKLTGFNTGQGGPPGGGLIRTDAGSSGGGVGGALGKKLLGGGKGPPLPPPGGGGGGGLPDGVDVPGGPSLWVLALLAALGIGADRLTSKDKSFTPALPAPTPSPPSPASGVFGNIDTTNIARNALIGTGIGAAGGALTGLFSGNKKKNRMRSLLENALLGGAGGAAIGGLGTPAINAIK